MIKDGTFDGNAYRRCLVNMAYDPTASVRSGKAKGPKIKQSHDDLESLDMNVLDASSCLRLRPLACGGSPPPQRFAVGSPRVRRLRICSLRSTLYGN
jgi:hypothetical protein